MHKNEAAQGFNILGNPDRVKILKMLYNIGGMAYDELEGIAGCSDFDNNLEILKNNNFIKINELIEINKEYVDELLDFIRTKCGCAHK